MYSRHDLVHRAGEATAAVPMLQIRLFGEFNLVYRDAPVSALHNARLHSLLAYLLLHRDAPQPRQHLAFQFWPDASEMQARNNLRQALHHLRRTLPESDRLLEADVHTLRWREDASFSLDVAAFEQALAQADTARDQREQGVWRSALGEAVGLYRADLLPSCYDEWIVPERERLRQQYLGALAALMRLLEAQHDYAAAIRHAQGWLRTDPLAEEACRTLMRLLALTSDRAGALRVYQTCVATLRRELGVEPSPATKDLYRRLLQMKVQPPAPPERGSPLVSMPGFIGRQREWEQLQMAWHSASAGEPRVALVSGEAGIGKSRLTEELLAWAGQQGATVAKTRSYAAEGQLSLAPVTDWLRGEGVRPAVAGLDAVWRTEIARILPELLAEDGDLPRPEPLAEYGQRRRFFEALARAILAAPAPIMLLIDDLQWCDQETLEWLHFLLRFDPAARLLVVGTVRAEERAAHPSLRTFLLHLANSVGVLEIDLQPLDAAETAHLAAAVLGRDLDTATALRLYRETEGNALFVVETARAGLSQAPEPAVEANPIAPAGADDRLPLPPRVYMVIAGRLGQLSAPAQQLVGIAAAIGRAFSRDILLHAGRGGEEQVDQALDELWNKRIVREHGANTYDFAHDKLREVAYNEISAPQRRLFHQRIAQAFEAANADDLDPVSGQIAYHYEHAGLTEQAIPHYQRAAVVALRVYANENAISLLTRGLRLLEALPAGMKRDTQELSLLLALAPALRVTRGWTAPEAEHALDRALALCRTVGDAGQRAHVLNGLLSVYVVQARFDAVEHIAEKLDTLYQRSAGMMPLLFTEVMRNGIALHQGELRQASDHFAKLMAIHDPDQMRRLQEAHGVNYMVHALAWHGHGLWCLGYAQAALTQSREAVQIARDLAQPFSQALAAAYLATLMQFCADDTTAKAHAEEALALATEYKALYYQSWSAILVDFAKAWQLPDAEHIARLRDSITAFTASGANLRLPYFLSLLARACGRAGRDEEGLTVLDEALAAAHVRHERWWDAELHRLRGELLLAYGARERDAEAALLQAITIAHAQQARSLELRAATSLARLRMSQRRADEGRRLLVDLHSWFADGLDTPDLRAAQSLLAQMA